MKAEQEILNKIGLLRLRVAALKGKIHLDNCRYIARREIAILKWVLK